MGRTAGWARAGRDYYQKHDRPKELWVQPLHPQAVAWLRAAQMPEALAAAERAPPPRNRLAVSSLEKLIDIFGQLPDVRRQAGRRHRLDCVLAAAKPRTQQTKSRNGKQRQRRRKQHRASIFLR